MYVEPKDSRQRYTKQCLFASFLRALEDKPVSQITVSEVCDDAGVSRKTFYKYYADPFSLLVAMQDDLFTGFRRRLEGLPPNIFDIAPALIAFVGEHRTLVRASLENRGEGNFIDRVLDHLYDAYRGEWERLNPQMSPEEVEFLFQFVASGLVGIIRLWLIKRPELPVEEVCRRADALLRLSTP